MSQFRGRKILIKLIDFLKAGKDIIFPHSCRLQPSCSVYVKESIEKYGAIRGILKGLLRIARCHPFNRSFYDPVK